MADSTLTIAIRLGPDEKTMQLILKLLDMWQEDNPGKMVALVPEKDTYKYEIIQRKKPVEKE